MARRLGLSSVFHCGWLLIHAAPPALGVDRSPHDTARIDSPHTSPSLSKPRPSASSANGSWQVAAEVHANELATDYDRSAPVPIELPPAYTSAVLAGVLSRGPRPVLLGAHERLAVNHGSAAFAWWQGRRSLAFGRAWGGVGPSSLL